MGPISICCIHGGALFSNQLSNDPDQYDISTSGVAHLRSSLIDLTK